MSRNCEVVGIGGMYLDVIASASYEFIQKHNIPLNGEREASVEELKNVMGKLANCEFFAGGAVSNTISGIANAGVATGFFGKVAKDQIGQLLIDDFRRRKIDLCCCAYDTTSELSPMCIIILTEHGERSMIFNPSCAANFSTQDMNTCDFSDAKFFLVEADLLRKEKAAEIILGAVSSARDLGIKSVFNLQGMPSWKNRFSVAMKVADFADIVIGNKEEVEAFEGSLLKGLSQQQIVVSTNGEQGVRARYSNTVVEVSATRSNQFISSVGAGDQFIAGFIVGGLAGKSLAECLQTGVNMASEILGGKSGRPLLNKEVKAFRDLAYLQTLQGPV